MSRRRNDRARPWIPAILLVNLVVCIITKVISVFVYHVIGPIVIAYLVVFHYLYREKRWAVWCYHALSIYAVFPAILYVVQWILMAVRPNWTLPGNYLLGACWIALALIHLTVSFSPLSEQIHSLHMIALERRTAAGKRKKASKKAAKKK